MIFLELETFTKDKLVLFLLLMSEIMLSDIILFEIMLSETIFS